MSNQWRHPSAPFVLLTDLLNLLLPQETPKFRAQGQTLRTKASSFSACLPRPMAGGRQAWGLTLLVIGALVVCAYPMSGSAATASSEEGGRGGGVGTCGNDVCDAGETCSSCEFDCGPCPPVCGDGLCTGTETKTTCADCKVCGDGACTIGEAASTCAADCTRCGDGLCTGSETASTCASDCTRCGDGLCTGSETATGCPGDCTKCGDGLCTGTETKATCADCKVCGDGLCTLGESCSTCSGDCGVCVSTDKAPVVSAPSTASGAEGSALTISVTASDPDGQPITSLTVSSAPQGSTFTTNAAKTSGTLSWTPSSTQAGTYSVTFTAANALSGSATTAITIADVPLCGDKVCNGTETCSSCSGDCGTCPPVCGDKVCNGSETCSSCSVDCGTCPAQSPSDPYSYDVTVGLTFTNLSAAITDTYNQLITAKETFDIDDPVAKGVVRTLRLESVNQLSGQQGSLYYVDTTMRDVNTGVLVNVDFDLLAIDGQLDVLDAGIRKVTTATTTTEYYTYDAAYNRKDVTQIPVNQ